MSGSIQIITCNDWWDRMWYMSPGQRSWFAEGVIVADVDTPLFTNIPLYGPAAVAGAPPPS